MNRFPPPVHRLRRYAAVAGITDDAPRATLTLRKQIQAPAASARMRSLAACASSESPSTLFSLTPSTMALAIVARVWSFS